MEKLSLEQRVQMLEDRENIKDITYQYGSYVNQGWNGITTKPEALRNIFTEDASWESKIMNIKGSGIDNIVKGLIEETKSVLFAMHCYANPVIKIKWQPGYR